MSSTYKRFFQTQNNDNATIFKKIFLKKYFTDQNMYDHVCSFVFYNQEEIFEVYCASLTNIMFDISTIRYTVTTEDDNDVNEVTVCIRSDCPYVNVQCQSIYCTACGEPIMVSTSTSFSKCTCLRWG
jgi:hypothetical protein